MCHRTPPGHGLFWTKNGGLACSPKNSGTLIELGEAKWVNVFKLRYDQNCHLRIGISIKCTYIWKLCWNCFIKKDILKNRTTRVLLNRNLRDSFAALWSVYRKLPSVVKVQPRKCRRYQKIVKLEKCRVLTSSQPTSPKNSIVAPPSAAPPWKVETKATNAFATPTPKLISRWRGFPLTLSAVRIWRKLN